MKKLITWAALGSLAVVAAACSSGGSVGSVPAIPTADPAKAVSQIHFTITIPPAASIVTNARPGAPRPMFTAAPNTVSASFAVTAVNGKAYSGAPTVVNFNSGNCTGTSTLTCIATITVPAGDDVVLVKTFALQNASGSTSGEANLQVSAAGGQTVNEPATLGGTIAKIGVVAFGEEGVAGTYPVIVTAYDSTGAAIIGAYNAPITLANSDTSGSTTLSATTVPDSATGANVTLKYNGAQMPPVTISATATGIAASNIMNATFPDATYPTVNNGQSDIEVDRTFSESYDGEPSPQPNAGSGYIQNTTLTAQTLTVPLVPVSGGGSATANNLVEQTSVGLRGSLGMLTWDTPLYYAWTPNGTSLSYGYVGYVSGSGSSGLSTRTNIIAQASTESLLCSPPYNRLVVLPIPTVSWDGFAGSGDCTYRYDDGNSSNDSNESMILRADGSYSDTGSNSGNTSKYDWELKPDGSAVITNNDPAGSEILTIPVPSPGADTATASLQTFPGAIPAPGTTSTPAPVLETAPNIWKLAGIPTGTPLISDKFTPHSQPVGLPAGCQVNSSLVGLNASFVQVDENMTVIDPAYDYRNVYTTIAWQHYYLNGVGEVCSVENYHTFYLDSGYIRLVQWRRSGLLYG